MFVKIETKGATHILINIPTGGCPGQWVKGIGPCQIGERINKNNQPTGQILPAGNGEMV